jgi:hypothetical protein
MAKIKVFKCIICFIVLLLVLNSIPQLRNLTVTTHDMANFIELFEINTSDFSDMQLLF